MIHGEWKTATVTAGQTLSAAVNLGRPYETLVIVCPELTTTATVSLVVAEKTVFQDLYITDPATGANIKPLSGTYTSAVFTWVVPIGGFQFIKVKLSASQAAGKTFRVMGVRS